MHRLRPPTLFCLIALPALFANSLSELSPMLVIPGAVRIAIFVSSAFILTASNHRSNPPRIIFFPFAVFAALGIASILWTADASISTERALLNAAGVLILWIFARHTSAEDQLRIICGYSAACIFVVTIAGALAYITQPASAYFQGNFRGYFSNSNSLGHYTSFAAPLCCAGLFHRSARVRCLSFAMLAFLIYLLLDTRSRAAFASVCLSSMVIFLGSRDRVLTRTNLLVLIPGLALTFYVFVQFAADKYAGVDAIGTRLYLWKLHLNAIAQKPNLGWGIGINPVDFKIYTEPGYNFLAETEKGSSYITLPEELGLWFAIPFYTTLIPLLLRRIYLSYAHGHRYRNAAFKLVPAGLVLGGLVHAAFESWLFSFGNPLAFAFWMSCIYLISHVRRPLIERTTEARFLESRSVGDALLSRQARSRGVN